MNQKARKPKVTVIMSAYNAERFVAESIQSVLNQTLKDFELIVINDASKDRTGPIVKKFRDKRIKYFERKQNNGKSHAVNFGFEKAQGKYACIFDADDVMVNYKLEVCTKILDKNPEYGLVYGNAWAIDEASEITGPLSFPSRAKRNIGDQFPDLSFSMEKLGEKCFFSQGSTLFRMEAIRKVGGLDEELHVAEDWDLWLRIAEKYKVYYCPVPLYLYRINPKGLLSQAINNKTHESTKQKVLQKMKERLEKAGKK